MCVCVVIVVHMQTHVLLQHDMSTYMYTLCLHLKLTFALQYHNVNLPSIVVQQELHQSITKKSRHSYVVFFLGLNVITSKRVGI